MKMKFCILINNKYNILILNKPANHLDKNSKTGLKIILQIAKKTLILVTHESRFTENTCEKNRYITIKI